MTTTTIEEEEEARNAIAKKTSGEANCNLAVTQMTQLVALNSSLERPRPKPAPVLERGDAAQFFGEEKNPTKGRASR